MAEPTKGQRRLMYGLFALAILVAVLGFVAIWALAYGPLS